MLINYSDLRSLVTLNTLKDLKIRKDRKAFMLGPELIALLILNLNQK